MINSGEEKLPSWNDSSVKDSIIDFVEATTNNGPNYVKPADRIATFDNDGTLWVEKPINPQILFIAQQCINAAQKDPSLIKQQPYNALIEKNEKFFEYASEQNPEMATLESSLC